MNFDQLADAWLAEHQAPAAFALGLATGSGRALMA